jgi:thymidylate synthase (FAD)
MRHWHNTPFEMVEFKFHIKMPIFLARQHMRHRTASINEMSARYSLVPEDYLTFDETEWREQSDVNKQSSEGRCIIDTTLHNEVSDHMKESFLFYEYLLKEGVCREQARCHLPQSTYTEFFWKINLHNLMHYLRLRMEKGAQKEIREYANEIFRLVEPLCPHTMEAFKDFRLDSIQLSRLEIEAIKNGAKKLENNPGENREFKEKLSLLGLD